MFNSNFPNQNFIFNGTDAIEYMRICTQQDVEATKKSILFDNWINEHSSYFYTSDGSIIISSDMVNFDITEININLIDNYVQITEYQKNNCSQEYFFNLNNTKNNANLDELSIKYQPLVYIRDEKYTTDKNHILILPSEANNCSAKTKQNKVENYNSNSEDSIMAA